MIALEATTIPQDGTTALIAVAVITAIASVVTTWLTVHQGRKVDETHKQVTVNHHSSEVPTVLDRIDDVRSAVLELAGVVNNVRTDFNDHVSHSNEMDLRLIKVELAKEHQQEARLLQIESEVKRAD